MNKYNNSVRRSYENMYNGKGIMISFDMYFNFGILSGEDFERIYAMQIRSIAEQFINDLRNNIIAIKIAKED